MDSMATCKRFLEWAGAAKCECSGPAAVYTITDEALAGPNARWLWRGLVNCEATYTLQDTLEDAIRFYQGRYQQLMLIIDGGRFNPDIPGDQRHLWFVDGC